jgi:hypothetical protein
VTAKLLGYMLELHDSGATPGPSIGVVAALPAAGHPRDVPVILVDAPPGAAVDQCAFRVALSADERRDALVRWRASASVDAALLARRESLDVVEWHHSLYRYGASELNERIVKSTGRPMTSHAWLAWCAVKLLVEASLRGGDTPCSAVASARFDGHKGRALSFDRSTRILRQPVYVVDSSEPGGRVLGEI